MNKTHMKKTKLMTECAILVALSTVLSLIKIWEMPLGGSVTLFSMLPVCYISVRHGLRWGLGSAFVYSVVQLVFGITMSGLFGWGLTIDMLVACMLSDYLVAFTVLGFAGVFRNKGFTGVVLGTALAIVLRFLCHLFSGAYIFNSIGRIWQGFETSNPWIYSFFYNGFYMLPELVITIVGAVLVYRAVEKTGK